MDVFGKYCYKKKNKENRHALCVFSLFFMCLKILLLPDEPRDQTMETQASQNQA